MKQQFVIFFYTTFFDVKKYLPDNYIVIDNLDGLKGVKYLDYVYYNQELMILTNFDEYKKIFFTIEINNMSFLDYKRPWIFDKDYLHYIVKKKNREGFERYFMEQITIKNQKQVGLFMKKDKLYIAKPIPGSGGIGIRVFNSKDSLFDYIDNFELSNKDKKLFGSEKVRKWVLQEYISNPLLIDGKKIHLRVMGLLMNKDGVKSFHIFKKYFVYTAAKLFVLSNFNNENIHNSHGKKMTEEDLQQIILKFYSLYKSKIHLITREIIKICEIIKRFLIYKCYSNNKNCYSLIGLDIMITTDFNVKLIEVNKRAGMSFLKSKVFNDDFIKGFLDLTLFEKNKTKDFVEIKDKNIKRKKNSEIKSVFLKNFNKKIEQIKN